MSSPNQPPPPPPIIRSPRSTSQSLSPYSHHLPPPNLQSNNAGPLPPRITELPSILSPPRNSASPSNFVQHANLPPPTSFPTEPAVLPPPSPPPPPLLPSRTPPFTEHRPNVPHAPPPSASQPQPAAESSQNGYRPLNVRDALTYLDQVKIRFSDKPDVYNQFLDIMKDFKSQAIDTPGVIDRVSTLFKGHPTLISGFNTFLPPGYRIECSAREPDLITVTTPSGVTTTTGRRSDHVPYFPYIHPPPPPPPPPHPSQIPSYRPHHHPSYPPIPTSHSPLAGHHDEDDESPLEFNHAINYVNRIKNRYAHDPDVYKQFLEILQTYQKDNKPIQEVYAHVQYLFQGEPDLLEEFKQFLPDITGQPLYDSTSHTNGLKRTANPSIKKKRAHYKRTKYKSEDSFNFTNNFDLSKPSVSIEEVELFERIRKHIGNKPSYEEFLKTLNLYTQHIVDMNTLIDQVSIFIGNNSELMDWFKSMIGYESKEHDIERPTHTIPKPDLNTCQTTGNPHESPSYRVVPKDWQNQPCSGRDQLCWEVLNDEYVSHPIWASEEDGFVASRKSQYEEAMHRCEEERYEYNMIIDANLNVISLMEPITQSIEKMTPEEKENFRLKPGLGGESVTIYERIIKKIYDKERGMEIIDLLYSSPAYVIPVVLRRLKQKDEEWKRAQREWNKIWRELDAKNFYRALDYQGITFKSNDRKAMAPKALVSEIEHILQQQKKKKVQGYQFKYDLADQDVFKDVTRVIYSFIDRQTGYSNSDRERVRFFIQTFIPLCFHVVSDDDSHSMQYKQEEEDEEDNHFTHTEEEGSETPKRMISKNSKRENDHIMELLCDILTNKGHEVNEQAEQDENSLLAAAAAVSAPVKKQNKFSFFCNTSFYCFFRLYQMLYERLEKLKAINDKMTKDPRSGKRTNRTATNLGLYSTRFDDVDLSKGYYEAILDLIDRFFDGDIDQAHFEEYTRYIFVTEAYLLFTIDKLVHTMVKQTQTIITDPKSIELIRLFKCDKELESMSPRTLAVSCLKAEEIVGPSDNLYKISFDNQSKYMTIQFIGKDNPTVEPTAEDRYEDYVASYMDWVNTTDKIDLSQLKPSFLNRNLKPQNEHLHKLFVRSNLQYKIDKSSYHMYYIVGSEDLFARPHPPEKKRESNWQTWLSSPTTGWSKGLDQETRTLLEKEANALFK